MRTTAQSLPAGLLEGTRCGWDIARVKAADRVVEINFGGQQPAEGVGFQCSGHFARSNWGPFLFAKILIGAQ